MVEFTTTEPFCSEILEVTEGRARALTKGCYNALAGPVVLRFDFGESIVEGQPGRHILIILNAPPGEKLEKPITIFTRTALEGRRRRNK